MKKWLMAVGLAATLASSALPATTTWQIDPAHSNAQFVVRHLGISNVQGEFTKISGTVQLDDQDISKSSVTASIDVSSVDTRVKMRDNDLRSPKFFDVAKYPTMTFQSTKIWKTGDGTAKMSGNLTLHGVTKEITFDVTGPTAPIHAMGGIRRGVHATTSISRKAFGITADSGLVGDKIAITIDAEIVQQ
ncbi:MAG: YceI family protein [Candidatus Acidiferrales bacterium]